MKVAPKNSLDADGRRYKVFYQSRLPSIELTWKRAPRAKKYRLVLESARKKAQRYESAEASHTFGPGKLREGEYKWYFEPEGGVRSPVTRLVIAFDNDAPVARIRVPRDGFEPSGEQVEVAGVVLRGAELSIDGRAVQVDRVGRFSVEVPVPKGGLLALRVSHRRTGIHYYLRHVSGPAP